MKNYAFILALCAMLVACGSSKSLQSGVPAKQTTESGNNDAKKQLDYVRKVNDNAVYTKNIVSKIDFEVDAMGRNISLDGKLQMRKDEVIRITVTPFGLMEAARLEFTPDYVLMVDRLNKQYVKATYNDVDFLKNNGLDFYTLQALFWNELFLPGKKTLGDGDLSSFTTDLNVKANRPVTMNTGKFTFSWNTDVERALINSAVVNYAQGTANASTMSFDYGDFVPLGAKKFPSKETLSFTSKAVNYGKMSLTLMLHKITTDEGWEARTSISEKYTQVSAEALLGKLVNM